MNQELDEAFEDWWEGDEDDEPITEVSKEFAKEIFTAGYEMGSRKSVFQMSKSQMDIFVRMINQKIEDGEL